MIKEEKSERLRYPKNKIIFDKREEHTVLQSTLFLRKESSNEINQTSHSCISRFSIGRV